MPRRIVLLLSLVLSGKLAGLLFGLFPEATNFTLDTNHQNIH